MLATPRSLGQILGTAFDLLRRNAPLLVGLAALVYVPLAFALAGAPEAAAPEAAAMRSDMPEPEPWMVAALALVVVALPIVLAGITDTCGALLRGRDVDAGTALRAGLALALPLVGTMLVFGLALVVSLAPIALLISAGGGLPAPVRVAASIGAALLPIVLVLRLSLLTQVVVFERVFGPRALVRAHQLIDGHVLRVFGTLFIVGLLMGLLSTAGEVALGSLPGVGLAATGLLQALGFAYTTAVGVVLYADVRARRGERDDLSTPAGGSAFRIPPPQDRERR
jgi:hypothetical protein